MGVTSYGLSGKRTDILHFSKRTLTLLKVVRKEAISKYTIDLRAIII